MNADTNVSTAPAQSPASPGPILSPDAPPDPAAQVPQAEGESDRAFEAFRAYLQLGPQRRLAPVARAVGSSLRTVKRWAKDFDWRGRIKTFAAARVARYAVAEDTLCRESLLDAATRAKAFRERQYALAEAILRVAERCLERLEDLDLDHITFANACKALEVASRISQQVNTRENDDASAPARALEAQLATLLDQACAEASPNAVGQPATPTQPQP
jgi:hypothetical protein